ncbi:MAG: sugar ABC transporter permease [Chloroflexi bacterium]|nr:sugar ABC transporter permease [Chloroflexota bacterium]
MLRREKWKIIIPFIVPGLILFTVFTMYPSLRGIYVSLFKWSGMSQNMTYIGLDNFAKLFRELTDPMDFYNLRTYLSHNLFMFAWSLLTMFLGLIIAAIINNKPFAHNVFRVTFFFPNVLALPAIAVLWSMTLNPSFGLVNTALNSLGLQNLALPWMSLQYDFPLFKLGLYTVGFIGFWAGVGWYMILFLAAIQNVPIELIEAAIIDGASRARAFWTVTVPLIWETVRTVLVFAVIGVLGSFALPFVLFERQPQKHSDMILNYYYWQAFVNNNWGYSAAIVVGIFIVTLAASIISYRFFGRETVQY